MNENYLNSSYERHKNDSTESLKKFISNQSKYSQEVVYAAKKYCKKKKVIIPPLTPKQYLTILSYQKILLFC